MVFGIRRIGAVAAAVALVVGGSAIPASAVPTSAGAVAKTGPVSVAYVEVNNHSMANVGKYELAGGGAVFDIGVIFAANINYDTATKSAYLYFNPNVQRVLDNVATEVRPLQAKGIKVTLSVLGNHQGAGFANFPNAQAAQAFAKQLADTVERYGLDGIDFDDEYSEYGRNGTGQPNASSFVHLVTALRAAMPEDKLITLYNIGPAATRLSYGGVDITSKFDYAWNPYYGTWSAPRMALPKSALSPAAVHINSTSTTTAANFARRTVSEGYGVYLTYDLGAVDSHTYISAFTRELYGSDARYTG